MNTPDAKNFDVVYRISPPVTNDEMNQLFADAWGNDEPTDFRPILERSLAYVCAYHATRLVGFVNIAWDGGIHGFLLDTTVHTEFQQRGIGLKLVKKAAEAAGERGLKWLHVDFVPQLQKFYDKCGFINTRAGLIKLN